MFRTLKLDTSAALQHGPSGNSRCPWCTLCLKISPAKRCKRLKATKNPLGSGDDGDPNVQDALVNMIKLEIGKKNVEDYVEESSEKLKAMAEEAKEEMERLAELSKMRGDVAFDSALADINREADEFAEQLRRSREEQEAKDREFAAWEDDVAASRSEGQFFKSLYQSDKKRPVGDSSERLRERAQRVTEPARQEVGSPLRFYLFLALAFLLVADVGADVASADPSVGPDLIYSSLAGLAIWLAINERSALK